MYTPQNGIFGNFLQSWQFSLDPRIPTIGDLMQATRATRPPSSASGT